MVEIGITFFIISVLIAGIWVFIELQRFKHKLFAIFLIGLILFTYVSFILTIKGNDINLGSVPGLIQAGKLYAVWLGGVFDNMKTVTAQAINMNWGA